MLENSKKIGKTFFAPIQLYEKTINSFLDDKFVEVDENGELKIKSFSLPSPPDLDPRFLSSGEKQILILLTEALLQFDKPVVYIADEPGVITSCHLAGKTFGIFGSTWWTETDNCCYTLPGYCWAI